ncbi:MAG: tRNA-dihydrouridine synthase, partial [Lachnospiraceae bacterium]|nr:tRNA-dihydrouridine synthase [Lachnospiraceae bacterium]
KGKPNLDAFAYAVKESRNPLCYNGDVTSVQDYRRIRELFPTVDCVMIGRGLLADPVLLEQIGHTENVIMTKPHPDRKNQQEWGLPQSGQQKTDQSDKRKRFWQFHRELLKGYREYMSGETPVLFKMKELWFYMQQLFPEDSKLYKKIKKAKNLAEYESIVRSI